ncbi:MAG TPA: hypothetical protein VK172_14895 [Lentimicrobium sp.]|nr:hypothetical protein [Bacteroidales bacterium]HLO92450.1 hypothetical protein [Lentimicrobium sp.]
MTECKQAILNYLKQQFDASKWPFFGFVQLKKQFGKNTRDALNALRTEGIIRRREGINDIIIEYLNGQV